MAKYILITIFAALVAVLNIKTDIDKKQSSENAIFQEETRSNVSASVIDNTQAALPSAEEIGPKRNPDTEEPQLQSRAVLVQDLESGKILYAKNENERLPIASITKLVGAQIILDKLNLDEVVTMSKTAINTYGGQAFSTNEKISAKNLFYAMLIASSNDAAVALAEHVGGGSWENFIPLMNERVKKLNLSNTNFANPTGLDDDNNYSTASDFAVIAKESLKYPLIWEAMRIQNTEIKSVDGLLVHELRNSNKLLGRLPNVTGGKTGYTDIALETFAFVAGPPKALSKPEDNHQVLYIILGAPIGLRFQETEKLVYWVDKAYQW